MKKRVLSLLAACAVITTSFVGLIQTAYAEGHAVRIVVSDTDADTQKTVKFYYEGTGADGLIAFGANLTISAGATIDTFALSAVNPAYKGSSGLGNLWFSDDNGAPSADGEFATATVTVPTDKDTIVSLEVYQFADSEDWEDYKDEVGTVSVTIPKKSAPIPQKVSAAVTAVEKQNTEAINGTGKFETQTADIYGVEITPNDESVKGARVAFGENSKELNFKTVYSGTGTVVFAVILASESGAELPTLTADNVTPITAVE